MRCNPLQRRGESGGEGEKERAREMEKEKERRRESGMRLKREEMFAEGCALVRLIGSLPASRSQVNRGGTPLARVQNSNYAIIVTRCVYARRTPPSMYLELAC